MPDAECPKCGFRFGDHTGWCWKEQLAAITTAKEKAERERDAVLQEARVWAGEAKAQRHTVNEVGSALGGVPDWGPIAKAVRGKLEALRKAQAEVERLQGENLALNLALFHVENGLGHPDPHVRALIEAAKAVRAAKPESEGDHE